MASKSSKDANESHRMDTIPDIIVDPSTKKSYSRGRFLGKGGFAKCYELTDLDTKHIYAGKIVSKTLLVKQHQKDKMAQEIAIHRSLKHPNIVNFICFFEDANNVYIILEICRRRSLMEMHKRRKAITEPETRYFVKQIVTGCKYLHTICSIIHRDLKLGNLFLNDEMELKIGDFGLATKIDFVGERKKTLCGTPNYIAPEVLNKKGHSYEVDVWSIGCIMYTLLAGRPPFETSTLKDTYIRIKNNEYHIPSRFSLSARNLIQKMLQSDPIKRPSIEEILEDDFMTLGYVPPRLPTTCLTMAPRFDQKAEFSMIAQPRKPLIEVNAKAKEATILQSSIGKGVVPKSNTNVNRVGTDENGECNNKDPGDIIETADFHMDDLQKQLSSVLAAKPAEKLIIQEDEAEDPAVAPMLWVSKWVDYSDKYGLGYQLCDNSVGVLFNDCTKLLLLSDGDNIHYIERDGAEHYHTLTVFPDTLTKKVTLLKYFRNYMNEHLLKTGAAMVPREGDELARLPYLRYWFRTRNAIVLHLTNGTLQINFFQDHTKVIVCPLMNAVTYIDEHRDIRTFRLNAIEKFGCSRDLCSRLSYARTMVERLKALHADPTGKKKVKS